MQPIAKVDGTFRFRANKVVVYLLEYGLYDMNHLVKMAHQGLFPREDMEQFYQLIGYSVKGYGELQLVSDESKDAAEAATKGDREDD